MKTQIEAILEPFRKQGVDAGCEHDGTFWQVWIGSHAGARRDGVALATFLAGGYEEAAPVAAEPKAEVLPRAEPQAPDPRLDLQAARIAELEAALAAKAEQAPNPVPPELADLIETIDTPAETSEKLLVRLREVMGLIGMAEDRGGRASPDLYRKRDRLESGIRWNRGRMAEVL